MTSTVFALVFFSLLLLMIGAYVLLGYRNLIRILLGVEVISKGITLVFLAAGLHQGRIDLAQTFIVTFIIVETVLAAVMLGLVILVHRIHNSLDIRKLSRLRG
jgi:NADH-quinone oxidoreductase subunit K